MNGGGVERTRLDSRKGEVEANDGKKINSSNLRGEGEPLYRLCKGGGEREGKRRQRVEGKRRGLVSLIGKGGEGL